MRFQTRFVLLLFVAAISLALSACNATTRSVPAVSMRESWISSRARELEMSGIDRNSASIKAQQEWDNIRAAEGSKSTEQRKFENDLSRSLKK